MMKNFKAQIRKSICGLLAAVIMMTFFSAVNAVSAAESSAVYTMTAATEKVGNIFTGKEFTFKLSITNSGSSTLNGAVEYKVYGETITEAEPEAMNTLIKTGSVPAKLPVGGATEVQITDTLDKYGVYKISFVLKDSAGAEQCNGASEFSLITPTKKNPKMGFSQHALCHGIGTNEDTAYFSDILGMGIVRDNYPAVFMYNTANGELRPETVNGTKYWGWRRMDSFTDEMNDHNIETLAIIGIGGDGVMDESSGITWPLTEEEAANETAQNQLYTYCYDLVKRYKGRCEVFEVFNEYDLHKESNEKVNEKSYAICLKTAAKAIKDANPNAEVVAMCSQNDEWVENVLKELGTNPGQYFDAISVHPYVYWKNTYPEQNETNADGWEMQSNKNDLRAFKRMLAKYGVADKPMYATEYGITQHLSNWQELNQHTLAAHLIRSTLINSEFTDKNYVYTLYKKSNTKVPKDKGTGYASARKEQGFGVLRYIKRNPDLTEEEAETYEVENLEDWQEPMAALPAAVALAAFNNIMCNAEYISDSVIRSGTDGMVYDYQYSTDDGKVCAVWDVTSDKKFADARGSKVWNIWKNPEYLAYNRDICIHVDSKRITVYDMYGNAEVKTSAKGNYKITIGKEPIYIKADTMSGLKVITEDELNRQEEEGYTQPYSNSDWRMILRDKSSNIDKRYKEGDGFGKETNKDEFFLFEMWY